MNEVKRPRGRPRKYPRPEDTKADAPLKVFITPFFRGADEGDGGVRRVVEGQTKYLPKYGIEIVEDAARADVLAAHIMAPNTWYKLHPDKPWVAMIHGFYWSEYGDWQNWAIKANAEVMELVRASDAVVAPSNWVANNIVRHTSRPVSIIPHGIKAEEWQAEPSLDYVLWNKTRPDPVCDPEPMQRLAELLPQVQFVSTFGNETSNVAVTGRLSFEEGKKLIQRAGIYLCTTRETFGIGTLEAMACGVPIVGYRYGGQAEFIEHMVDGYLATPEDLEDLARGILWARENRSRVGAKAREKALKFTWDSAAAQYAKLFKEVHERYNKSSTKTTVVVTNYNLHKYLDDCLKSVKAQTNEDWECLILDDASPDPEGRSIAQRYADEDKRFRLIANEKNVYLAEARNIAIREARGKYILPLDADDMLAPRTLEVLSGSLERDRAIHVAYGNVYFVEEDGKTPTNYGHRDGPGYSGWPMQFSHEQQIMQRNLLPYCSMFRRDAWEHTGGYRRRSRTAEDAEFWTRLSSYGFRPKMVTSEDTLVYRNREGSMSRKQGGANWVRWFGWAANPDITPAGAVTKEQLPIPSLDPIVISVVIPVGPGHEVYVHDAVDSVDAQSFRNWECIVVNDTGKPLPELPAWVRVVESAGKSGPGAARNAGIRSARGKLFLPLDADDYLEPDALQWMFTAYWETGDVIYCDFWQTGADGKDFSIHKCDDYDPTLLTGRRRSFEGQIREGMIHSVTALTPIEHWEKVGGYDESLSAWEDWDFQLSIADIGVCSRRIAAPLFVYRKHTGFRREENYEFFERSKEGILRKWGDLWEGGRELASCSLCGSKRTFTPGAQWGAPMAVQKPPNGNEDTVLVEYVGNRAGGMPFKGKSGTVYWFAAGEQPKYVLSKDLDTFKQFPNDFHVVQPVAQINREEPVLVAEGNPNR